jgi:hypothetical protein
MPHFSTKIEDSDADSNRYGLHTGFRPDDRDNLNSDSGPEKQEIDTPMKHRLTMFTALVACTPAYAAVLDVPESYASITAAVAVSADGDVIRVGPGVWNETMDFRGKSITIESTAGPEKTWVTGGPDRSCVLFTARETPDAVLDGFTISGGVGMPYQGTTVGAGIYVFDGSNPTIRNCVIRDNEAQFGAGVHIALSSPTFDSCTFIGNVSESNGAAVRIHDNSFPSFTDCIFLDNHTNDFGGAIAYGNDSTGVHINCQFDGNTADIRGGAIYLGCSCSEAQVSGSDFCNSVPDHIVGNWSDDGGNDWCPVCEDDINADGVVNVNDLLAVISRWGACVCMEDINGDALVNVDDLLLVIQDWGTCPG